MADDPKPPPSDRRTTLETSDGEQLEARWSVPADPRGVVVLTHPHPQYGGDMDNIVPASLARSLPAHGWATIRVNFRGVGASTGTHGRGRAERLDVEAAIAVAAEHDERVAAVGYSFGADVLLSVSHPALEAVVAVAPPLAIVDLAVMREARSDVDTLVISPAHDQFRAPADAAMIADAWDRTDHEVLDGADHFLAGATARLVERVVAFLDEHRPHGV